MLINFEFENFRSFKDKTTLSMKASSQTTFNDTLIRTDGLRILPSAVIYGANASGKSNVIMALSCFQDIVMCGNISSDILYALELYPFAHDDEYKPIRFTVEFINKHFHFKYGLGVLTGKLEHGNREIVYENLSLVNKNGSLTNLFNRGENGVSISDKAQALSFMEIPKDFIGNIEDKLNKNLDSTVLFLTSGFKSIISSKVADIVIDFFTDKLVVFEDFPLSTAALSVGKNVPDKDFIVWNELLDVFVKAADFGPQKIYFRHNKSDEGQSGILRLYSDYEKSDDTVISIPSLLMESRGTLKMIDFAIPFQKVLTNGGTLVFDEFDSALHPEIVKGIISLFGDADLNTNGAQLIFTTHNPIYLNNKIFRRDQIIFIDKDTTSYRSALYTLASFGSEAVRNDENYLINYFKGKYSSMPYIDFSLLLKNSESSAKEDSEN